MDVDPHPLLDPEGLQERLRRACGALGRGSFGGNPLGTLHRTLHRKPRPYLREGESEPAEAPTEVAAHVEEAHVQARRGGNRERRLVFGAREVGVQCHHHLPIGRRLSLLGTR
ncbi:MAG: hypothetical protein LC647_04220 [Beggiatoa sp.]|nr:hypothetical protein [Beggiatoa sp.]